VTIETSGYGNDLVPTTATPMGYGYALYAQDGRVGRSERVVPRAGVALPLCMPARDAGRELAAPI
jgi:hypothetical protein